MKNGIEMKYTPNPIQTDDISLSDDLVALTELIAANVHDVSAASRIKEGWTYGKIRILKRRPRLALCRMTNCLNLEKSMIAIQQWKRSN